MDEKRVLVIANKWWECDPIMSVLLNDNARPAASLGWPHFLNHPRSRPEPNKLPAASPWPIPRAIFALSNITVEIWCISDLLEHLPDQPENQSSSERKIEQLSKVFIGKPVSLVLAIGTAAFPRDSNQNGDVVVGTKIFMHNANPANPDSKWAAGPFDTVIDSPLEKTVFDSITTIDSTAVDRFLIPLLPPPTPATKGSFLADFGYVALGSINVTSSREFSQADQATLDAYQVSHKIADAKSLETTHGLIRVQSEAPFAFVSGIANRVGRFQDEVGPRFYAQNTTAAHNAGVILAWMIPKINNCL
jgi:hypothetical protein